MHGVDLAVRREQVGAEHDPAGMAFEQRARRSRLTAELGDARRDVGVQVRVRVEHPSDPREVLCGAGDMRADERRPGMPRHEGLERDHEVVEARQVGPPNHQSGFASSSSSRSFRSSTGSKNAIGSARWIVTGTSRSAAAAQTGSSRSSSGAISRSRPSRNRRPRCFHTFNPRAPRATESRSDAAIRSPKPILGRLPPVKCANVTNRPGNARSYRSRLASSSSPHMPSRFTIAATLLASMTSSSSPTSGAAHVPSGNSHRPRWLCASTAATAARGTWCSGTRRRGRGGTRARAGRGACPSGSIRPS